MLNQSVGEQDEGATLGEKLWVGYTVKAIGSRTGYGIQLEMIVEHLTYDNAKS